MIDMNDLVAVRNQKQMTELDKLAEKIRELAGEIVGEVHDLLDSIDRPGLSHQERLAAFQQVLRRLQEIHDSSRRQTGNCPDEPPAAASQARPKPGGPKPTAPKAKAKKPEPIPASTTPPASAPTVQPEPVPVPTAPKASAPEPKKPSDVSTLLGMFKGKGAGEHK